MDYKDKLYSYRNGLVAFDTIGELIEDDCKRYLEEANTHKETLIKMINEEKERLEDMPLDALAEKIYNLMDVEKLGLEVNLLKQEEVYKKMYADEEFDYPKFVERINKRINEKNLFLEKQESFINEQIDKSLVEPQILIKSYETQMLINDAFIRQTEMERDFNKEYGSVNESESDL